ncbi:hypothetical protein DACRYDRAFT_21288 [Dacryopinax primogenitus]|uniref:HSF-type DNA-binding domain-containing protein n=1 Tax=Dacryopinax primogenitus (strain DJM 731) TaxID=1858805 RepID=M5GF59_DACPD|nr:uncharacterized protein DACRYDRAFT_21288 [Dacryopinax primogenitus]EJU03868.1 hypothetical protein DACRYDRAFT_21288 [Dacryopinax primogenitus]
MDYAPDTASEPFAHSVASVSWGSPRLMLSPSSTELSQQSSPIQLMFPNTGLYAPPAHDGRPSTGSSIHSRPPTGPATSQLSLNLSALSVNSSDHGQHSHPADESPEMDQTGLDSSVFHSPTDAAFAAPHPYGNLYNMSAAHAGASTSPRIARHALRKRPLPQSMDEQQIQETMAGSGSVYSNAMGPIGLGIARLVPDSEPSMGIDPSQVSVSALHQAMDDTGDLAFGTDGTGSGMDGSPDSSEDADGPMNLISQGIHRGAGTIRIPSGMSVSADEGTSSGRGYSGRPPPMNNFVTKLYHMILDPKAAPFISWTDMGASFVVSSVTEFSKTVLGSHFKHNNFSSFVRQLNMYGFHKINRTPRASRSTGTDQTWEFSHPKFLRGRPDLLDEIKRKALEPDLTARQRVELPAEVANQLGGVEGRIEQIAAQLMAEKEKNQRLALVVRQLCDWLANMYPGQIPIQVPTDLLECSPHPHIYVSHTADGMPINGHPVSPSYLSPYVQHPYYAVPVPNTLTPQSTPTSSDFPDDSQQSRMLDPTCDPTDRSRFIIPQLPHSAPAGGRFMRRNVSNLSLDEVSVGSSHHGTFMLRPSASNMNLAGVDGSELHQQQQTDSPDSLEPNVLELNGQILPEVPVLSAAPKSSGRGSSKRQRPNPSPSLDSQLSMAGTESLASSTVSSNIHGKLHRVRSDSAPLGFGLGQWQGQDQSAFITPSTSAPNLSPERRPRSGTLISRRATERSGLRMASKAEA